MDKYKKWEDPPFLKNTTKCLFFSSLRLNWHPFATQLLANSTLGILFCVFVLCAIVCVLRSLSAGKSSSLRCITEGEPFPFQPLVFCPDENLLPNSLTHDFNHWLCHCIYSHLKVLQILQHATLMHFITRKKLESVYFIIKGKGGVFFLNMFGNKEAKQLLTHISLQRHCNPFHIKCPHRIKGSFKNYKIK